MIGLDCDLDSLVKARPSSKEHNAVKHYKEAKERAETLGRIHRDLEKKLNALDEEVENIRNEKHDVENKYWSVFRKMERKIEKFKEEMGVDEREFQI